MQHQNDRRRFLQKSVLGIAGAVGAYGAEEQILLAALQTGASAQPAPAGQAAQMPRGKIGNVEISRLFMGGNLIGGWAHARDLIYVSRLFKAYNTEEKVFETFAIAESYGINTVLLDPLIQDVYVKYREKTGSNLQSMVCIRPSGNEADVREQIRNVLSKGATLIYTHGEATDRLIMDGNVDAVKLTIRCIKESGVPAGVGSHSLETPKACEAHGVNPDYYVKTFHADRYWSATPPELREEWCWYKGLRSELGRYHDNIWCLNAEETAAFFRNISKPWVAFKVMAAGAIHPRMAFPFAFRNGADFICAGMFDFQIAEDVQIALESLRRLEKRERPWCA
jgi:phosphoheptose isomerase